jgi:hypothetical protein
MRFARPVTSFGCGQPTGRPDILTVWKARALVAAATMFAFVAPFGRGQKKGWP